MRDGASTHPEESRRFKSPLHPVISHFAAGDLDRCAKTPLRFGKVRRVLCQHQSAFNVMQLWPGDLLPGLCDGNKSLLQHLEPFLGLSDPSEPDGQIGQSTTLRR